MRAAFAGERRLRHRCWARCRWPRDDRGGGALQGPGRECGATCAHACPPRSRRRRHHARTTDRRALAWPEGRFALRGGCRRGRRRTAGGEIASGSMAGEKLTVIRRPWHVNTGGRACAVEFHEWWALALRHKKGRSLVSRPALLKSMCGKV